MARGAGSSPADEIRDDWTPEVSGRSRTAIRTERATRNRRIAAAYDHGHGMGDVDPTYSDEERMSWQQGWEDRLDADSAGDTPPSPGSPPARSSAPKTTTSVSEQGAGLLVGLLAYAVASNYIRGGWPGVKTWFAAKFYDQPASPSSAPSSRSAAPATGTAAAPTPATLEIPPQSGATGSTFQ